MQGIGLRTQHLDELLSCKNLPLLEVVAEQFAFQSGGPDWAILHHLKERGAAFLLHGLHLNIGGYDPLDQSYLKEMKRLCETLQPAVYSDHLAFSQWQLSQTFDLLPLPLTSKQQQHVIERVRTVQDLLGRQLALENISAYHRYDIDRLPELEFLQGIADATGCGILLDLNNLYVNARNFAFDPFEALKSLDAVSIVQYHGSGHTRNGRYLHDTHDQAITAPVWELVAAARRSFGDRPFIIERDDAAVTLQELFKELAHEP